MKIAPFKLERYFAKYEFSVKYLLSSSDCDGLSVKELLRLADDESKKMWEDLHLGYTESLGLPLLREEVSKLYTGINKDHVLIVAPEEGIFITMNSVLQKGDHVICTFPGYQSLYEIAKSLGCEVTKWLLDEQEGWKPNLDFLEQNIKKNTKMIVINFPHNPTGSLVSKDDFQKIVDIARKHNLYLFSDEMYRFLEYTPTNRLPTSPEVYDKAISLFGMSKTFGMAGVRIGWLITKDESIYNNLAEFKDYTTICPSAPSEILALMALRAKDKILNKHLKKIGKNLKILDSFFEVHKDKLSWVRPKAGTICFPRLLSNESSLDFCQRLVKEAGIMLLPSTVYEFDDKHVRIGFGRENMPEVVEKLDAFLSR